MTGQYALTRTTATDNRTPHFCYGIWGRLLLSVIYLVSFGWQLESTALKPPHFLRVREGRLSPGIAFILYDRKVRFLFRQYGIKH